MEDNLKPRKDKRLLYAIMMVAVLVVATVGITYAFFSYTRTRSGNTVATGRISFTTSQSTINLTNAFPVDVTGGIPNDANNVGVATINVKGDTTYGEGIEYKVEAVGVTNTAGSGANTKSVPISIDVSVTNNTVNDPATNLGSSDDSYYSNRGGSSSIYKIEAENTINTNDLLLVGYIAEGAQGVDGNIVIKAYFDMSKIAITDTDEETEWAQGKTVFTTSEWNSLRTNGVSFQVRVTAQEGVWIPEPTAADIIRKVSTLETNAAGNKIYTGTNAANYVTFNGESWRIIGVYGDKLKIVKAAPLQEKQKWQNSNSDGNTWDGSLLETYLNTTYYDDLSQTAQEMIAEGSWNVGGCTNGVSASDAYTCAHGTTLTGVDTNSNRVKVGLIASYEYLYATENDGTCWTTAGNSYSSCMSKDWLYVALTNNGSSSAWTLSPRSDGVSGALHVNSSGNVSRYYVSDAYAASPVVYLNSNVRITGGDGQTPQTAYTLSYTAS